MPLVFAPLLALEVNLQTLSTSHNHNNVVSMHVMLPNCRLSAIPKDISFIDDNKEQHAKVLRQRPKIESKVLQIAVSKNLLGTTPSLQ